MSDFTLWLQGLGLENYGEVLVRHDIDLLVAPDLTDQDLEKIGLSLGSRRKFMAAAAKLRSAAAPPAVEPGQPRSRDQVQPQVERRQITVVFSDLVGSTALAKQLDPEDMGGLLRNYREACAAVVRKYDGFIAQYLGDGILAYFGYPQAQEHSAERAVRAGLEIVREVGRLTHPDGLPLQARAGIATGLVATNDMTGPGATGEQTVVGETPNLAARLQALAEPGCALVDSSTHQLTRNFFEYVFTGEHQVKGYAEPLPAWRAAGESAIESRFVAAHAATAGPILGRERELAFLSDAWDRATRGEGHVVLVSGEAGMGKSRLVEGFAQRIRERPHRLLRCQCSPYHRSSPLYPLTQLLRHDLGLKQGIPAEENFDGIDRMLARIRRSTRVSRLLLAELLAIPVQDTLSPMEMTLAQRKNEMLAILEDFLLAPLEGATVLLMLEDAHWSDPTTRSLVDRLLKRVGKERALVLITQRPELKTPWSEHPQATLISCKQLVPDHCAALVRHVAGKAQMDDSVIEQIVARSDGVPIYAEELAKAVLDLKSVASSSVPLTLQDSLTARLDQLGTAKKVAQIASVIGRQFSHVVLAAIAGESEADLRGALDRLKASGLVLGMGEEDEAGYCFNHSLVQEASYESLARSRRRVLHAQIAELLASGAATTGETEPALVAYHFSRARQAERAFQYWMQAAQLSGKRTAYAESLANLNSALEEAGRIPDSDLRRRLTLDVQLQLGAVHGIQSGPSSSQAESALSEAYTLAKQEEPGPKLFQAAWGLYLNAAHKFDFDKARLRGDELIAIGQALGDEDLQFEALHHRWGYAYFTGQTEKFLGYSQEGIDRYDAKRHHRFSEVYAGHDPGVCAYYCHAIGLGLAGRSKTFVSVLDAAIALADDLQHPVTLAFALGGASLATHLAGDFVACREKSERLLQVAQRYDFAQQRAFASFMQGLARTLTGDLVAGLQEMSSSFELASTYRIAAGYASLFMADALLRAGRHEEALSIVTRVLDALKTPESGLFVSEFWRLRGELTLKASSEDVAQAERYLKIAARIASGQGAKVFHLRAGISLARLLADQGRRSEARSELANACSDPLVEWSGPEVAQASQLRSQLS